MKNHPKTNCTVCGKLFSLSELTPGRFVRPSVSQRIAVDCPAWDPDAYICQTDVSHSRS